MVDWGKRVFLGALVGAVLGVLLGLGLARVLWSPADSPPPASAYPTSARQEVAPSPTALTETDDGRDGAVVMVSALYALDGDLDRARERLVALGLDDASEAVADLALRHASTGSHQLATDLATLATALGHEQVELLAYVATTTPTATPTQQPPTHTPTSTPTATPTRQPPTHTPVATPTATPTRQPPTPTRRPPTRQPPTATALPAAATPLPLEWDRRVDMLSPPVRVLGADVAPGQRYWRLVRLEWWKQSEGGNMLLYVSTLNEHGQPVWGQEVIIENGGHTVLYTDPKPGESYGVNFIMDGTLNSYHVFVGGDLPSDRVVGLGLGEALGTKEHTTFVLAFQRSKK